MKIEIRSLSKDYGGDRLALDGFDLTLESPSLIGLVGPNGAGKTTLMKLLVAQLSPTSGEIHVDGGALSAQEKAFKRRLGYLPKDLGLYDELTVYQFLNYLACLKGTPPARKDAVLSSLERTGLQDQVHARIKTLSGGQRQRVGIAQALLNSPELSVMTVGRRGRPYPAVSRPIRCNIPLRVTRSRGRPSFPGKRERQLASKWVR